MTPNRSGQRCGCGNWLGANNHSGFCYICARKRRCPICRVPHKDGRVGNFWCADCLEISRSIQAALRKRKTVRLPHVYRTGGPR